MSRLEPHARPTLRFSTAGTFTIAQFTDLHWANGDEPDRRTRALIERVLDLERPDLVALTGDVVAGRPCRDPAESWRAVVAPIEERGIPWAAVFGNHDDEGISSRADLMAAQQTCRFCFSEPGQAEITGVGNYVLPVLATGAERLAAALYFLDSNSYGPESLGTYGWFARDQIDWYAATAADLAARFIRGGGSGPLPALAFFHIPLPEYNDVWDYQTCRGEKYEPVCCPPINTGMFAAMIEAGDVMGTFVGHDHVNDFEGTLHGIRLCYGRWSGYSTYGHDRFVPGARMIRLSEGERGFDTWLRLADGSAVESRPEHAPATRRVMSGEAE